MRIITQNNTIELLKEEVFGEEKTKQSKSRHLRSKCHKNKDLRFFRHLIFKLKISVEELKGEMVTASFGK